MTPRSEARGVINPAEFFYDTAESDKFFCEDQRNSQDQKYMRRKVRKVK